MIEDHNTTESNASDSIDNLNRLELLWEHREELVIETFAKDCIDRSLKHSIKAEKMKKLNISFTIPTFSIPIILSGLSEILTDHVIINNILLISVGILSGTQALLKFGEKYQRNSLYSNLFKELSDEISVEISKPKKHRVACDVYLERIRLKYSNLVNQAPDL